MPYLNDTFRMMAREAAREQAQRAPSYFEHNAAAQRQRFEPARFTTDGQCRDGGDPYNSRKGCAS